MALVRTLTDRDQDHFGAALPPGLRELYDGDLRFRKSPAERPFVIANFVSTLDGVVSYEIKGQAGGSTVSGSDTADGFIMGLLRASADASYRRLWYCPRREPRSSLDPRIYLPRCKTFVQRVPSRRAAQT